MIELPIVEMLKSYANANPVRAHMPGHKGVSAGFLEQASKYDITELSFSDNLFDPCGVIRRSEELFARLVGVKNAHYSVNGSTAGIFAFVNSCKSVLIERCAHYSVFNAVRALGKKAYVVTNDIVDGVPQPVTAAQISKALSRFKAEAVLISGANYYGLRADVEGIYACTLRLGVRLYVDAAHGAHYGLSEHLPPSFANACDAYVISTHKTLSSFTQTAALCVCNGDADAELKKSLAVFTSSSPSYLLLASMDYARADMLNAREGYERLYEAYVGFCAKARRIGVDILNVSDFTRLVIGLSDFGVCGKELYGALEERGIYCEFYDDKRVCALITYKDDPRIYNAIYDILLQIPQKTRVVGGARADFGTVPCVRLNNRLKECVSVPLSESIGRVSGTDVVLYPPGVVLILRGEKIDKKNAAYLLQSLDGAVKAVGITDGAIAVEK